MAITGSTLIDATTNSTFGIRKYTERYHVTTDAPTTALRSIVDYSGIPKYGAEFNDDSISVVQNKSAQQVDGTRTKFIVTVEYAPYDRAGHNSLGDEFNNPLDAPSEYTWGYASRQEVITHDKNQNPILNTAGDQFIPAAEKTVYDLQLTVVQNLEDYKPLTSWEAVSKVNSKEFTVAGLQVPVKAALLTERTATSEVFEDEANNERIEYWTVTTVIQFRMHDPDWVAKRFDGFDGGSVKPLVEIGVGNAWYKRILNSGLDEYRNGEQVRIRIDGQEVTDPKLLKENGTREPDPGNNAFWIGADIYDTFDFGTLQL